MIKEKESALIAELKQGSIRAFERIYQLYAKRLLAYSVQYTKCYEDAEEIVEDVFVRLWNNRGKIHTTESLSALLFIMSKHHLINAYRATLNSPVYEDYVDYQNKLSVDEAANGVDYEHYVRIIKAAMKQLPLTQQRIIQLAKFASLPNKEIAIRLSLSEQTVKNQLSLGLKALRGLLDNVLFAFMLSILIYCE